MKLLLTSNGISNRSIGKSLLELSGKPARKLSVAFIPTAANIEHMDKWWMIEDMVNIYKLGFKEIDVVDISALPRKSWEPRLRSANILAFSGGHTSYLMYWIKKSGLSKLLPSLLKTRIYMGISAGSIVAGSRLLLSGSGVLPIHGDAPLYTTSDKGLGLVDFGFRPHLNSSDFPEITIPKLQRRASKIPFPFYAIDDMSAIQVNGSKVKVVSEGKWKLFNS